MVQLKLTSTSFSNFQHTVKNAGCIIIGDEILNSKIVDTNSRFFAKKCYENGINLRKITVVGDNEEDIIDTVHQFVSKYDFTITTGGIGSTHDDLSYQSIAKAFKISLEFNQQTYDRAMKLNPECVPAKSNKELWNSFTRMICLPYAKDRTRILYSPTSWTPVVTIDSKLAILPGVPKFFEDLLANGLFPHLNVPGNPFISLYVVTKMQEVEFGPYLSLKQKELLTAKESTTIKLGSYPHYEAGVDTISITGRKSEMKRIEQAANDILTEVNGIQITREQEFTLSNNREFKQMEFLKSLD